MAGWDDVRRLASSLPEVEENDRAWRVGGKLFVWERPLRKNDVAAMGAAMRDAPILAARVEQESDKHELIADSPQVYFTIPHFNGYNAILVWLDRINSDELRELVTDAWLIRAPKRVASAYLEAAQPQRE